MVESGEYIYRERVCEREWLKEKRERNRDAETQIRTDTHTIWGDGSDRQGGREKRTDRQIDR